MNLDYYHLPLLAALGALAAVGGRRETLVALAVAVGLGVAFVQPAVGMYEVFAHALPENIAYLVTMVPLTAWLARDLLSRRVARSVPTKEPAALVTA